MKRKIIIVLIIVLILSLIGIGYYMYGNYNNNKDTREIKYTMKYSDMGIPGNSYDIYIYDNIDIKVVKHPGCSTLECAQGSYWPSDEEYELKYNDELKTKLANEYIPKIFVSSNNISINLIDESVSEETNKFLYAVIYKDESKL